MLVIVVAVVVATWVGLRLHWKARLRAEIAAVRLGGWPATREEVDRLYAIPAGTENAAGIYLEAVAAQVQSDGGSQAVAPSISSVIVAPYLFEPLDPNTAALIADYLEDNKAALELLHRAACIEHCRYPGKVGTQPFQNHIREITDAGQPLILEAYWSAYQGQAEPATAALESAWALADSLDGRQDLIHYLAGSSLRSKVANALQWVLGRTSLPDQCLQRLYRRVAATQCEVMAAALAAERASLLENFSLAESQRSGRDSGWFGLHPDLVGPYFLLGLADRDLVKTLELYRQVIEFAGLPLDERSRSGSLDRSMSSVPRTCVLAHAYAGYIGQYPRREAAAAAVVRSIQVGLAVERFRLAGGSLPADLEALVPAYLAAVPKDPFDGKPLRYLRQDQGYRVYSLGYDLADNHGTVVPKAGEPGDIVFRVGR